MSQTPYLDAWIEKQAQGPLPAIIKKEEKKMAPPKPKKAPVAKKKKPKTPVLDFDKGDFWKGMQGAK